MTGISDRDFSIIGRSVRQVDGAEKLTGTAVFAGDVYLHGMLFAAVLRSPIAHGLIQRIDVSRAERVKGVKAVVTGNDCPFRYNPPLRDQPFLAIDRVRYVGEPVVAIAAEDEETARRAALLVEVDYEELPAVFDPLAAMSKEAPRIHPDFDNYVRDSRLFTPVPQSNILSHFKLRKGNVDAGFAAADRIFEGTYRSHAFNHAPLEPHAAVAQVDRTGQLTLWASTQSPWFVAEDLAKALGWPVHRVRVISPYIGGGFGIKHGLKNEPIAVALALKTNGRPVRFVLSREEVFSSTAVRGAVTVSLKTGVRDDGSIVARKAEVVWDTGAYADVGPLLCRNGSYSATGPYRIENQWIDGYCVYTNKIVSSAFRGYGVMEMAFAYESHTDEIARALSLDTVEYRRRILLREGDENATGEVVRSIGLRECLDACAEAMDWDNPVPEGRGRAIVTTAKSSVAPSGSSCFMYMNDDGSLTLMSSTTEMGQGSRTVLSQIAAESVGARLEDIRLRASDTAFTPPDRSTSSSRSTFNMGNAVFTAGQDVRKQILSRASALLEVSPDELEICDSTVQVRGVPAACCSFSDVAKVLPGATSGPITAHGSFVPKETTRFDLETGRGARITAFWLYSSQGVEVSVDGDTGEITVHKIVSVHDTGRTLNPSACAVQAEGGVAIACSAALTEETILDEHGRVVNPSFMDYEMATAGDVPEIVPIMVEVPHPEGPYGAKGMGEGPTTGVAAAIANAVADAADIRVRDLPLTPERILRSMQVLEG